MNAASQMTKVELPAMMFELGTYTVESFSASANTQTDEELDQEAHTSGTNRTLVRAFI